MTFGEVAHRAPRTGGVRFAPSPTGRFHVGNLRTAWISYHLSKILNLKWVIRVEDIDRPRVLPGAQEQQLADMEALGLIPDLILLQSEYNDRHWALFLEGIRLGQIYACDCSRKEVATALAGLASAPHDGQAPVYTGTCRLLKERELLKAESIAWRFRMPHESGRDDFIIARTGHVFTESGEPERESFVPAYHWACAIDDYDGAYDLLVRSSDLKPALGVQRAIQSWVASIESSNWVAPAIYHTSLVTQNDGHRLEKRTRGVTLPELLERGVTPERLSKIFEASWVSPTKIEAESINDEPATQISLENFGISS